MCKHSQTGLSGRKSLHEKIKFWWRRQFDSLPLCPQTSFTHYVLSFWHKTKLHLVCWETLCQATPTKPFNAKDSHGVVKDPAIFLIPLHTWVCPGTFCGVGMIMSCEEPDTRLLLQPRQSLVVTGTQRLPSPCRRLIDWPVSKRGNVLDSGQRRTGVPRILLPPTWNSSALELCVLQSKSRLFCVAGLNTKPHLGAFNQRLSTSCSGGGWSCGGGLG